MTRFVLNLYARSLMLGVSLYAFGAVVPSQYAQSATTITPSGLGTLVNGSENVGCTGGTCNITGGARPGNGPNLFHSFGNFSLNTFDSANFLNNSGLATTNILSRVTGGNPSSIFGTINTLDFPGANVFLMNPAGIVFGPTAQLNVSGSFHATTADYIKLGNNGTFYADLTKPTVLSIAPPSAFGFLSSNPASIDVQAGVFDFTPIFPGGPPVGFTNVLQVPAGQTLSFVGGPINVGAPPGAPPAGFLLAPEGRINLVSAASAGEAGFNGTSFSVNNFAQLGDINIKGNSIIDGKDVFIRGGRLVIEGGTIFPGLFFLAGAPVAPPNGGEVNIQVSDSVDIIGQPPVLAVSGVQAFAGASFALIPGDVPNISIKASSVSVSDGALIQTSRLGPGNPSNLSIEADTVAVRSGASVNLLNSFEGPGGTLTVNARDVTLDSAGSSGFTGIAAQANFHPAYGQPGVPFLPSLQLADSGSITVNATDTLAISGKAQISADSFAFGKSGNITVNAGDMILTGAGTNTGSIAAQSGLAGGSGDVTVNATGNIDMQNGFRISANTLGSGDGGQANVNAGKSITLSGTSTFISSVTDQPLDGELTSFAQLFNPLFQFFFGIPIPDYPSLRAALGVTPGPGDLMQVLAVLSTIPDPAGTGFPLVAVTDFSPGTGGKITITTPVLTAKADARIETSTAWDGNAGAVGANVGSLILQDGAVIGSRSGAVRLDRGFTVGTGNAGTININAADTIEISGGSTTSGEGSIVTTSTFGDGNGGDILLSAGKQVLITNGGSVTADSLGGTGLTGNITINAGNQIVMTDGSVSTRAVTSDGGNISLTTTGSLIHLTNSQITTSVQSGEGGGGNIAIDSDLVVLDDSRILANAFGGPGGNINIIADVFLVNSGGTLPTSLAGIVDASSALSTPGTINIEAAFTDVSGEVAQLPEAPLQATELLRASCAARFAGGKASSLVLGGRDGVPTQPGGLLPSPLYLATDAGSPAAGMKTSAYDPPARFSLLGSADSKNRLLNQYSLLPNFKCAL